MLRITLVTIIEALLRGVHILLSDMCLTTGCVHQDGLACP